MLRSAYSAVKRRKERPWPLCDRPSTYAELRRRTQVGNSKLEVSSRRASERTEASSQPVGCSKKPQACSPAGVPEKPGLLFPRDDGTFHELLHRHISPCYSPSPLRRAIGLSLPCFLLRRFRLAPSSSDVTPRRAHYYESASSHGSHAHAFTTDRSCLVS